jgi:hypothetical protein
MQLSMTFRAVMQAHPTDSFQLAPSAFAMHFPQSRKTLNPSADCAVLYAFNWADKLEYYHETSATVSNVAVRFRAGGPELLSCLRLKTKSRDLSTVVVSTHRHVY